MKIRFLLFAMIMSSIVIGQDVRLSVQTGHSSIINDVSYNHDCSLIASCSSDNNIVVWHIESGKQYASYSNHQAVVNDLVFHPEKNLLFAVSRDSTLSIWDVDQNLLVEEISFNFPLIAIDLQPGSTNLAIAGEKLILYDYESKKKRALDIHPKHNFSSVTFSKDGSLLVVGGQKENFGYLINVHDNTVQNKFFASVNDVVFADDMASFYYATEHGGINQFDLSKNRLNGSTNKSEWNSFNGIRITKDYIIGVTDNAEIVFLNRESWKKELVLKAHLLGIRCLDVDLDKNQLVTAGEDKRLILWDIQREEMIRTFQSSIYRINQVKFSENEDEVIIGFANGFVRKTNLLTNNSISNRVRLTQGQIELGWSYFMTGIGDVSEESINFDMLYLRSSKEYDGAYNHLQDMTVEWDLEANNLQLTEKKKKSSQVEAYEKDLKQGKIKSQQFLLKIENTTCIKGGFKARIEKDKLIVNEGKNELYSVVTGHTDRITSVDINEKHQIIATSSWDGMIKIWDLKKGTLLTTFGAFGADDFVYLNQDNYYFASKGALENIGFILNSNIYAFDQFDLIYNRPDIIFSDLPFYADKTIENYYKAYQKRLSKLGLTEEDLEISENIPELKMEYLTGSTSSNGYFAFKMEASDQQQDLKSFHVLVNGVPIFTKNGKKLNGQQLSIKDSLKLNPGKNVIKFYVTNDENVSSFKKSVEVFSKEQHVPSDLYVMTLGCSKFKQSEFDLNYADKDAADIISFFNKTKLYDHVHTKSIVNQDMTKSGVQVLKDFIAPARENDVVVLFVAGHGVLDANLDYFIAAHDMDFQNPAEKGIPIQFFEDLLDQTKSRKKLMFIDACHSGEIDKDEVVAVEEEAENDGDVSFRAVGTSVKNVDDVNSFELSKITFADMRESNGSTVVSSSGGGEFSMEGDKWKNGIFTYALLKGLKEQEADLNKDRKIMVSELQRYLIYTVNQLTGGLQTPTSRVENLINDFRIF